MVGSGSWLAFLGGADGRDVLGVAGRGRGGVVGDGGGGIAEGVGDDRYGSVLGELVQGAQPGRPGAEVRAQPVPEVPGAQVLAGETASEHPRAVRVCCGGVVARCGCQGAPGFIERGGQGDRVGAEDEGDQLIGDHDVLPGQLHDVFDLLAEDEHKDRRSTVAGREVAADGDAVEGPVLVGEVEPGAGAAAVRRHGQGGVDELGGDGPVQESMGGLAGGGPFGLPLVQMGLLQAGHLDSVGGEPVEEVDGHRGGLLGGQERAVGHGGHGLQAALVVPADEPSEDLAVVAGGDPGQCGGGPVVVADDQFVPDGQGAVGEEQGPDVLGDSSFTGQTLTPSS